MEADWEVEIGGDSPVIDAAWGDFVDLRRSPQLAFQLQETAILPSLADALMRLNAVGSPVWTSKCDVWPVPDPEQLDPDEMDASGDLSTYAWACYIDLLPRSDQQWIIPEMAISWCKILVARLRAISLSCCRVDIVIRTAMIVPNVSDIGLTAYLTACGSNTEEAKSVLQSALENFAAIFFPDATVK